MLRRSAGWLMGLALAACGDPVTSSDVAEEVAADVDVAPDVTTQETREDTTVASEVEVDEVVEIDSATEDDTSVPIEVEDDAEVVADTTDVDDDTIAEDTLIATEVAADTRDDATTPDAIIVVAKCPERACEDDDPCTTDRCDPETGACSYEPADGPRCDDGDDCSVEDLCVAGECVAGAPRDCSDGNACTLDACRLGPTGEALCTSLPRLCDDGNACTSDACVPATGCSYTPRLGPCSDGDPCTVGDQCGDGACVAGAAASCDDGRACTVDACDPALGCTHVAAAGCDCGNGRLEVGEACDDGNGLSGDGCSGGCMVERCGDGVVQAGLGEQCDDGARKHGDGCDGDCHVERCGDAIVHEGLGEQCDDGDLAGGDGCGPTCKLEGCGDALVQAGLGEQCDDGNDALDDGCTPACRLERCGDGAIQASLEETCDDGNQHAQDGCSSTCRIERCGDGIRQTILASEQCDDGNNDDGDGCDAACALEFCGDGTTQAASEECDDGNDALDDGCGPTCRFEGCGDGFLQASEGCEDGGVVIGDGCDDACQIEPCALHHFTFRPTFAGRAAGWQVRDQFDRVVFESPLTTQYSGQPVTTAAFIPAGVYSLVLTSLNNNGWFGSTLELRGPDDTLLFTGSQAQGPTTTHELVTRCVSFCGDGVVEGDERCDDGNADSGDGCRPWCLVEGCGDGLREGDEACDDRNTASGDGCSDACTFEPCATRVVRMQNLSPSESLPNRYRILDAAGAIVADGRTPEGNTFPLTPGQVYDKTIRLPAGRYRIEPLDVINAPTTWETGLLSIIDPDQSVRVFANGPTDFDLSCAAFCGDTITQSARGETCDDGNTTLLDGCGKACQVEACGDGVIQVALGERCDDGNTTDGDTCLGDCALLNCRPYTIEVEAPLVRSQGTAWSVKTLDGEVLAAGAPGAIGPGDVARFEVRLPPGTVVVHLETMSNVDTAYLTIRDADGNRRASVSTLGGHQVTFPFAATCVAAPCGDGVVGPGEQCDAGDVVAGDGCSPGCTIEVCGDGWRVGDEACDDGNVVVGDGCSGCDFERCTAHRLRIRNLHSAAFQRGPWRVVDAQQRVVAEGATDVLGPGASAEVELALLPGAYRFEPRAFGDDGVLTGPANWELLEYTVFEPGGELVVTGAVAKPFTAQCRTFCGDTEVQPDEQCDDGNRVANDGCGPSCALEVCGDGILHAGEACDRGDTDAGDGCGPTCAAEPCARHTVEITTGLEGYRAWWRIADASGRTVASGNGQPNDTTTRHPFIAPAGDYSVFAVPYFGTFGYLRGKVLAPDGAALTTFEVQSGPAFGGRFDFVTDCRSFCGDGTIDAGEECDDGGAATGDGCGATCLVEACGDGTHQPELGEGCDDGNRVAEDGCSPACVVETCGDGIVQAGLGEECEDGNELHNDGCGPSCTLERCGDGTTQRLAGEVCDDGNDVDGDACSNDCRTSRCAPLDVTLYPRRPAEIGFTIVDALGVDAARVAPGDLPAFPPSVQRFVPLAPGTYRFTGVGLAADSFGLSAVSLRAYDGAVLATIATQQSTSWGATDFTLPCVAAWCGDGVVQAGEACDDGNTVTGDGCSVGCVVERCGDGVVQRGLDEACDDGNDVARDGCDACAVTCKPVTVELTAQSGGERVAWRLRAADGAVVATRDDYPSAGQVRTAVALPAGSYRFDADDARPAAGALRVFTANDQLVEYHQLDWAPVSDVPLVFGCVTAWCGDGLVGAGETCDDGNGVAGDGCTACVIEGCGDGATQPLAGEECDDGDVDSGDGCSATCLIERCGDGVVQADEDCDDGPVADGDGCDAHCRDEVCGNAVVQVGEDCDDGDDVAGDGCDACALERCGDGVVQPSEDCDDGALAAGDGCDAACRDEACGNGVVQVDEGCDDGGESDGDGCSALCAIEACARHVLRVTALNGAGPIVWQIVDANDVVVAGAGPGTSVSGANVPVFLPAGDYRFELSDIGFGWNGGRLELFTPSGTRLLEITKNTAGPATVPFTTTCAAWCGDGLVSGAETCDDGGTLANDGCSSSCTTERCGDGVVQPGEQCDDANEDIGDGCTPACRSEACGNGALDSGEQCDDGDDDSGDGCSATCRDELCGDGVTQRERGEACDDGDALGSGDCGAGCLAFACVPHRVSVTIDNFTDPLSVNWRVRDQLGRVVAARAAGSYTARGTFIHDLVVPAEAYVLEATGDTNLSLVVRDVLDRPVLTLSVGIASGATFRRAFTTTCITAYCGDGALDEGEACDDGNRVSGDGCTDACVVERCGDGVVQPGLGEQCDEASDECAGCAILCGAHALTIVSRYQADMVGWRVRALDGRVVASGGPGSGLGSGFVAAPRVASGPHTLEIYPVPAGLGWWRADVTLSDVTGASVIAETVQSASAHHGIAFEAGCVLHWCGDGALDAGETCDDGDRVGDDGCGPTCLVERCGDGVVQSGEQCDDGGDLSFDGCSSSCRLEVCGDGVVYALGGETCDDGNRDPGDGCDADCGVESCGDGILQVGIGEECDDAGTLGGDGCDADCAFERPCTDYELRVSHGPGAVRWELRGAHGMVASDLDETGAVSVIPIDLLPTAYTFVPYRDNQILPFDHFELALVHRPSQTIVDTVTLHGYASATMALAPQCIRSWCGDDTVDGGEACDDGNFDGEDGCSATCDVERCGDTIVQAGLDEQCDDGATGPDDGCSPTCAFEPCAAHTLRLVTQSGAWMIDWSLYAGDRLVASAPLDGYAANQTIDVPLSLGAGSYRFVMRSRSTLGWNGATFSLFDRTGAVRASGGLATALQARELAFEAQCVTAWCGDGVVQGALGEVCDDGDRDDDDGCSATCQVESCGDGVVQLGRGETCDDGAADDDDGCSATCQLERCGDGVPQPGIGEGCDDGGVASNDGCSATCQAEVCGDGVVQSGIGETCDDGDSDGDDGCSASCVFEPCATYRVVIEASGGGRGYWEILKGANKVAGLATLTTLPASATTEVVLLPGPYQLRVSAADGGLSGSVTWRVLDHTELVLVSGSIPWGGARTTALQLACTTSWCGDDVVDAATEACDDGNRASEDGCSAACQPETCGDGIVQAGLGEVCDDDNTTSEDGCSAACLVERCGDTVVQAGLGESCDDGDNDSDDGCSATCRIERCGDGVRQASEGCDDGNVIGGDGCSACVVDRCGDTIVQPGLGETCDDGDSDSDDGCSATCRIERCGDGVRQASEGCDDGNIASNDGCSASCVVERCGDGTIQAGLLEGCDDGDADDGDGCDANCFVEACGNAKVQHGETCDDGNTESDDGCDAQCAREVCGNGKVQVGEGCDDGDLEGGDGCDAQCVSEVCGNAKKQAGEQCDDGNTAGGDGCDAACRTEVCGNTIVQPPETCDDGNTQANDGCDAACRAEVCGNGKVQVGEQCDDGNVVSGDGCAATCQREACAPVRFVTTTQGNGHRVRWFVRDPSTPNQVLTVGSQFPSNAATTRYADIGAGARVIELDTSDLQPGWGGAELVMFDWNGAELWRGALAADLARQVITLPTQVCIARWCGDAQVDAAAGEACDDGWNVAGDGCSPTCRVERCGDGVVHATLGEQCDDGDTDSGDGCDATCISELCGNYRVQPPEGCDDGNQNNGDGCDAQCVREVCGNGKQQGSEGCDDGDTDNGDGCDQYCRPEVCGNGILQAPPEGCDDGNLQSGDRCDAQCVVELCGNGKLQIGEACDDGNDVRGDGCDTSCTREICGNGRLQPPNEACDDGNTTNQDGCDAQCAREVCGNGKVQAGEGCDDGNKVDGDGCDATCVAEVCGNGRVQANEGCDDGNVTSGDGCTASCVVERCGDNVRQAAREGCDDGNLVNGDGCDATCVAEVCGNGRLQVNEGCDDGNLVNGDGCDATCVREVCGNGKVQAGEACDAGAGNSDTAPDACRSDCKVARCGDGTKDTSEACDAGPGNGNAPGACRVGCVLPRCADGVVDPGEGCDDNNTTANDGCSPTCVREGCGDGVQQPNEQCEDNNTNAGDGCDPGCVREECGNGKLQTGEQCDDGAKVAGDGCDAACVREVCGNNKTQAGEQCDDGNTISGDGCTATCVTERCGDGVLQAAREGCDDGNVTGGDGCSATCTLEACAAHTVRMVTTHQGTMHGWVLKRGATIVAQAPIYSLGANTTTTTTVQLFDGPYTLEGSVVSWSPTGWQGGRLEVLDGAGGVVASLTVPAGSNLQTLTFEASCARGCGDGVVQPGLDEQCDDGNLVPGDGCGGCAIEDCARHRLTVPTLVGLSTWTLARGPTVVATSNGPAFDGELVLLDGTYTMRMTTGAAYAWDGRVFTLSDAWGGVVASDGLAAGETTRTVTIVVGCGAPACGDGVVQPALDEACDDGNSDSGDGCSATCASEGCGDTITQPALGESCDDGDHEAGDGCDAACHSEVCGNGVVQANEACDDGNTAPFDGCSATCAWEPCSAHTLEVTRPTASILGFSVLAGERVVATSPFVQYTAPGKTTLTFRAADGNYRVVPQSYPASAGWSGATYSITAPFGVVASGVAANPILFAATCEPYCGDGYADDGEGCDDGNTLNDDGCSATCVVEVCGDGIVQASEACDDADDDSGDGCDGCAFEACASHRVRLRTGNDATRMGWIVRDAAGVIVADAPLGSLHQDNATIDVTLDLLPGTYTFEALGVSAPNGNGWVGASYEVRALEANVVLLTGTLGSGTSQVRAFTTACRATACGDGLTQALVGEACDDGAALAGDGCSPTCTFEPCSEHTLELVVGNRYPGYRVIDPRGEVVAEAAPLTFTPSNPPTTHTRRVDLPAGNYTIQLLEAFGNGWGLGSLKLIARSGAVLTNATLASGASATVAVTTTCITTWCGDSTKQAGEQCDDGNRVGNDGCSPSCVLERCGDGVVQPGIGEQCDDGNLVAGDACTNACKTARCGDGVAQTGVEACDDGDLDDTDLCTRLCQLPRCGDGAAQLGAGEQCDDGNTLDDDACTSRCTTATCGDGSLFTSGGEACDDGNGAPADGCASCAFEACARHTLRFHVGHDRWRAGYRLVDGKGRVLAAQAPGTIQQYGVHDRAVDLADGPFTLETLTLAYQQARGPWLDPTEPTLAYGATWVSVIDDQGGVLVRAVHGTFDVSQAHPLSAACVNRCGDGVLHPTRGETCDDGNVLGLDGCGPTCLVERCGDGVIQPVRGETCDDGNTTSGDGCTADCRAEGCGDGVLQAGLGEQCDDGNLAAEDGCGPTCKTEVCGDGVAQTTRGEQCDAGPLNANVADRCRPDCKAPRCGDAVTDTGEQCDWGAALNASLPSACRPDCKAPRCGDGVRDANEACDDHNTVSGDACAADCGACTGPSCPVACAPGEPLCSDGNATPGDGCDGLCRAEVCGNGIAQAGEQCDDGNTTLGDGCTPACQVESPCRRYLLRWTASTTYATPTYFRVVAPDGAIVARNRDVAWDNQTGVGTPLVLDLDPTLTYRVVGEHGDWAFGVAWSIEHAPSGEVFATGGWGYAFDITPFVFTPRCVPSWCGDGRRDLALGEQCDDGNRDGGDGCDASCGLEGCGDGVVQRPLGEQCDDGNLTANDGCDATCRYDSPCADHTVVVTRAFNDTGNSFLPWQVLAPDGAVVATDADATRVDGRTMTLPLRLAPGEVYRIVPRTGTYVAGWDPWTVTLVHAPSGTTIGASAITGMTTNRSLTLGITQCILHWCGDGSTDAALGETCDDGDRVAGDGCNATCQAERCSDGVLQPGLGEQCDDGNLLGDDACTPTCGWDRCSAFELSWQRNGSRPSSERTPSLRIRDAAGNVVVDLWSGLDVTGPYPIRLVPGPHTVEMRPSGIQMQVRIASQGNDTTMLAFTYSPQVEPLLVPFTATCVAGACGNGQVDANAGEVCDDGNRSPLDGCSGTCQREVCGDGVVQRGAGEVCDDGNTSGGDQCAADCRATACGRFRLRFDYYLGNAVVIRDARNQLVRYITNVGEKYVQHEVLLDLAPGAYHLSSPTWVEYFTLFDGLDNVVASNGYYSAMAGYDYLMGRFQWTAGCTERCGDSAAQVGEQCDDGNVLRNDGCTASCQSEGWRCGDGIPQPTIGEQCDDGGTTSGDGCSATCTREYCGDGIVQVATEPCDDGNRDPHDDCTNTCQVNQCGNGALDPGEECDPDHPTFGAGCLRTCRWAPCTKHTITTQYLDPAAAIAAIPGLGTAAALALAGVSLALQQTLVWQIWDEARARWVDLPAPESYGLSSASTVTLWPGYGVVLPVAGGGVAYEAALEFLVRQITKRANPFAAFAALYYDWPHPGIVLPPGQYRWRRFVTVPGAWALATQWVTNAFGQRTYSVADLGGSVEPGWHETTMTITCDWQCGDGVVQGNRGEQCDDGNLLSNDGCSAECLYENFVMQPIPGGAFIMGTPPNERWRQGDENKHPVVVGNFELGRFEVNRTEWAMFMSGDPTGVDRYIAEPCDSRCAAEGVWWYEAALFANRLSAARGLQQCYACAGQVCTPAMEPRACNGYRLPTEAEWEYAARGGGRDPGSGVGATNHFGLQGMIGSVPEWTHDFYGAYPAIVDGAWPSLVVDPRGPATSAHRISRGGGFDMIDRTNIDEIVASRNGDRHPRDPTPAMSPEGWWKIGIGFRLARTLP